MVKYISIRKLLLFPIIFFSPLSYLSFSQISNPDTLQIVGEKFCDVDFINNNVLIKGLKVADKIIGFGVDADEYLSDIGIKDLSETKSIVYGKGDGLISLTFVFDNSILSFFLEDHDTTAKILPLTNYVLDKSIIFQNTITVYGVFVAATTKTTLITTSGISNSYTDLIGCQQPILLESGTTIEVDTTSTIFIKCSNIITKDGKVGMYRFTKDGTMTIEVDRAGNAK